MKVLFLVRGVDEPSVRFRVFQYVPHLRRRGIDAEVADLPTSLRARWRTLAGARAVDVVVVHRAFLSPLELGVLRRAARRWVYDFDDALMFRDSAARRFASWQRRARWARMVRRADAVTAGNRYLADWAARYNAAVTVVPTVVEPAEYVVDGRRDPPGSVIGWIGTRINLMYVRAVVPALQRVAQRRPGVTLKIVSDGALAVPGVSVINQPWARADEARALASFRVGIMPLADDPWTHGKCAVKILQYLTAGVPVVCSPVGVSREIIRHGTNGYCADSEEEWVRYLDALLQDDGTHHRFAAAGRALVAERYSAAATVDPLIAVLRGT